MIAENEQKEIMELLSSRAMRRATFRGDNFFGFRRKDRCIFGRSSIRVCSFLKSDFSFQAGQSGSDQVSFSCYQTENLVTVSSFFLFFGGVQIKSRNLSSNLKVGGSQLDR